MPAVRDHCLLRQTQVDLGDRHRDRREFDAALGAYRRLDSGDQQPLEADIAWRIGLVMQQQGDHRAALAVYQRVDQDAATGADHAQLLAGLARAHWWLGNADDAVRHAREAVEVATASGDALARCLAHVATALAVSLNGDPATVEEEYARAAGFAAEAGSDAELARIAVNRSHHLLADARFGEAVALAAEGAAGAERLGSWSLLAVALGNEAEGLIRLGRYAEAVERCGRAAALAGRIGTHQTSGVLVTLAGVHLRHGAREQARAALEQALRLTPADGDRQVRVPALTALALTVLPDEPEAASALVDEALQAARGSAMMPTLLAAGWVAWVRSEHETARMFAARAVDHARRRHERTWLAEALELRGTTADPSRAAAALREAHRIWTEAEARDDADRVLVRLAGLSSASAPDRLEARLAGLRLAAAGVQVHTPTGPTGPIVRIITFGRFEVQIDGVPVAPEVWQSRRARDLLRLLVCRRGRAVPRLEVCELLWPDDDPDRTGHRLSVLLSIVRGVVGPSAVVSDAACVALDPRGLVVDVEEFLNEVSDALALRDRGAAAEARQLLTTAVRRYTDEPFADTPYDDLTRLLRDEARAAMLRALRVLADLCRRSGDHDEAADHLRRLLAEDRYDEDAHRGLLAVLNRAGWHGQARLAAARYRAAMADLGLRPTG